jgi:hypothetical protein
MLESRETGSGKAILHCVAGSQPIFITTSDDQLSLERAFGGLTDGILLSFVRWFAW